MYAEGPLKAMLEKFRNIDEYDYNWALNEVQR